MRASDASASRTAFFRERFPEFWFDVGGEPYALLDAFPMERERIMRVRSAAREAWWIIARIAPVVRALPDAELQSMGIPALTLRACRHVDDGAAGSVIARFDFALIADEPKVLEINAETPMFFWESHEIAGAVATTLGFADPNAAALAAVRAAIARAVGPGVLRVAVTAYNVWREDWYSAVFAARVASEALGRNVDAIPLHELRIERGRLCDGAGAAIDVLWRFYPLEHFAGDRGAAAFFDLIESGALRVINPPTALLLQNKALLALVWEFARRGIWFDAGERAAIAAHFLPTFLEQPADGATYVRKPVLGREGDSIAIVRGDQTLFASPQRHYAAQPAVYQRFVPLPQTRGGHAIVTCFVVDGEPGAVAMRIGDAITDARAQFLPIGMVP